MRPEERAEVRVLLTEKHGPQDPPPSRNFLIKILLLFLELPFRAANVPHPGQGRETAGVTLAAGKREEDEVPNWPDCVTVGMGSGISN